MDARRLMMTDEAMDSVVGWDAGLAWIGSWRRFGDWVVVDRVIHPEFCRNLAPDSWQVLWYDSVEAGDVRALLAELRSRKETRRILVVYRIESSAGLDAPNVGVLRHLCESYGATLLTVIERH